MDVVGRTCDFLRELLRVRDGSRILVIAHSANRWALEYLLEGVPLAMLISEPFRWREGWEYILDRPLDGPTIL